MTIKLKPCPFCGGTDLRLVSFSGWGADVIICGDCLATFSQKEITCEEDLIKAWNKRATDEKKECIVHCEDCRFSKQYDDLWCERLTGTYKVTPDGYCNFGKKKIKTN